MTFFDVVDVTQQACYFDGALVHLIVGEALIFVHDVCVGGELCNGGEPKLPEGRPEVLVDTIESSVY